VEEENHHMEMPKENDQLLSIAVLIFWGGKGVSERGVREPGILFTVV